MGTGALWWSSLEYCESRSIGNYTDLWVVDYMHGVCAKDCDPTLGPPCIDHTDYSLEMFGTAEECCSTKLGWTNTAACAAESNTGSSSGVTSGLYYADATSGSCLKDCPEDQEFGCTPVPPPIELYASIEECCDQGLNWVNEGFCVT